MLRPPPADLLDGASLFLDFDGTLVELAARPDAVVVGEPLLRLVGDLVAVLHGRVAIVSGRSIAQIGGFLGDLCPAVSGSHGLELRWADGRLDAPMTPVWLADATAHIHAFAEGHAGVVVEEKPFGAALHWRQAPGAEAACLALADELAAGGAAGMMIQPGKMMVELRPAGSDKGSAVRRLMTSAEMAEGVPIFIGDDLTDEPAFAAAADLGGHGILVGEARETRAAFRLAGVADTLAWLAAAVERLR